MTKTIRPARADDIPRLVEIRAAVRENRLVSMEIGPADYLPYVEDGRCWVAEADGAVMAFAAVDADAASIWALFVDPAHEGRGLGRFLLDRLIAEAKARGIPALNLETAAGTRAEAFYRRAGWQAVRPDGTGSIGMRLAL